MSDWFDKVTEEDIGTEDVSCGLEEMGVPADDSLDAYDMFYAKECNLPVSIDFIFTYQSTMPDDYDVLRSMKYEMRTSPEFRTSALFYFTRLSEMSLHRTACEGLSIKTFDRIVATFYTEAFTPERFDDIVQMMHFIKAVEDKYNCIVSMNYNRVVVQTRETIAKYAIGYTSGLRRLTDRENLGSATLPNIVDPLLQGSVTDTEEEFDKLRNEYSHLVTNLWHEYNRQNVK